MRAFDSDYEARLFLERRGWRQLRSWGWIPPLHWTGEIGEDEDAALAYLFDEWDEGMLAIAWDDALDWTRGVSWETIWTHVRGVL